MTRAVRTDKDQHEKEKMKKERGTNMNITKYLGTSALSVALLLAAGIPALARNSRTVTIQYSAVLQGTALPAGKYSVQWQTHSPEASVQFLQHHKIVLSAEGRVEQRDRSYERDSVVYNTSPDGSMSLVEIRFADSNKVLVFNQ
jgi:hypothetical protein